MTPPSLTVAREILISAAARARERGDQAEAMAIDVVLAELDARPSVHGAASVIAVSNPPARTAPMPGDPVRTVAVDGGVALDMPAFHAARRAAAHGTAIPPEATADEMLPCPFCRSTTLSVGKPPGGAFPILDRPYVSCTACGARGPLARSDANREAIANWNRRPGDTVHDFKREPSHKLGPDAVAVSAEQRIAATNAKTIRIIGRGMGYGRLMQIVEEQWREVAGDGSELTVGPCAGLLVPCVCTQGGSQPCAWCEGARRVTQRVRNAIEALHVDDATCTMTATPDPARCSTCGAALPLSPGRPGCAECHEP